MDCDLIVRHEIAERYLLGDLSFADQEAYEQHFFGCEPCFRELRELQSLQAVLGRLPSSSVVSPNPAMAAPARRRHRWASYAIAAMAASAAVAALLLVPRGNEEHVTNVPMVRPGTTTPGPGIATPASDASTDQARPQAKAASAAATRRPELLASLARVAPPSYAKRTFRGIGDKADQLFDQGMQHYVAGDFKAATPVLRQAAAEDRGRTDIAFFLAASELMERRYSDAKAGFEGVAARGDTPFVDEANFYLAKACIGLGQVERAQSALGAVIAGGGDLAREARSLSAELERLPDS